ncbi:hypothetical protein TrLO_g14960, partial [Triparma laevis f. longispina]
MAHSTGGAKRTFQDALEESLRVSVRDMRNPL